MIIKIKKLHSSAVIPQYAHMQGDAAVDLVAIDDGTLTDMFIEYRTGLAFELPPNTVGLLFPRSSISKYDLSLCNAVGVLDESFRGEVTFRFNLNSYISPKIYAAGDRIGQLIVMPIQRMSFTEVKELSNTERGTGGYGSSNGKKKDTQRNRVLARQSKRIGKGKPETKKASKTGRKV